MSHLKSRKLLYLLLFVAILGLFGALTFLKNGPISRKTQSDTQPRQIDFEVDTSPWITFENKQFGYVLRHPEERTVEVWCFGGGTPDCIRANMTSYVTFWNNFEINVYIKEGHTYPEIVFGPLIELANATLKENISRGTTKNTSLLEEYVGGKKAYSFIVDGPYHTPSGYKLYVFPTKHIFFNDGVYNYEISYPEGDPVAEEMVKSFSFVVTEE